MSESHHKENHDSSPKNGHGGRHSSDRDQSRGRSPSGRGSPDKRDSKDQDSYTQVYVAKLHRRTNEDDLRTAFSQFGKIKDMIVKHSYAFIDFEDHQSAMNAIKEMDRKTFVNGEELVVE
jgi:RNA recognition motif-containing protein